MANDGGATPPRRGRENDRTGRAGQQRLLRVLGTVAILGSLVTLVGPLEEPFEASAAPPPVCGDAGTPSVLSQHDPHFYVDNGVDPQLRSNYAGYSISSSTPASGLWIGLSGFTGGVIGLGPGQPPTQPVTRVGVGETVTRYFLLNASSVTTAPQTHTVTIYQGSPSSGGTPLCSRTFTYLDVVDTIKAAANKVEAITALDPVTTAVIGQTVTVEVDGFTGTLGSGPRNDPGVLAYNPVAYPDFPAGSWQLIDAQLETSPNGVAPAETYSNRLYLTGASGPNRPYTATYKFRAIAPTPNPSYVAPVQYIASGTQVKHTALTDDSLIILPPIGSGDNAIALSKSAMPEELGSSGGQVAYTVTLRNTSTLTLSVDDVMDTLPAGVAYVPGSSRLDGVLTSDPVVSGQVLTWASALMMPAGATRRLTFTASVPPSGPGTLVNSVVAHIGVSQLDATFDVSDDQPATASLEVVAPPVAVADVATTNANTPVTVPVVDNDSSPTGRAFWVISSTDPAFGTTQVDATGSITYTPDDGTSGFDAFDYTISDGLSTATATVNVTVRPRAMVDIFGVARFSTLVADVLANDLCSSCTAAALTSPSFGTATLSPGGTLNYDPNNSTGSTNFTYRITDTSTGLTSDATVYIEVGAAIPDGTVTLYQTPRKIDVVENDYCGSQVCSDLTITSVPSAGSAVVAPADPPGPGAITRPHLVYTPPAGFSGIATLTYSIDGQGFNDQAALVFVLVTPAPTTVTVAHGGSVSGDVLPASMPCSGCQATVKDPPFAGSLNLATSGNYTYSATPGTVGADTLRYRITHPLTGLTTVSMVTFEVRPDATVDEVTTIRDVVVNAPVRANDACPADCTVAVTSPPAQGGVVVEADHSITYTPAPGFVGTDTFTYSITDPATGLQDTATVTVHVDGALDDTATTDAGQTVSVDVLANDPCVGCTITSLTDPPRGAVEVVGSSVEYTPGQGFSGIETFDYTLTTPGGTETTATVTVTVLPVATDDDAFAASGSQVIIDVLANDTCVGCQIVSAGAASNGGTVTIRPDHLIAYTAPTGGVTSDTFTYMLEDIEGNTSSATVTVAIADPPDAVDDARQMPANSVLSLDVRDNDTCGPSCLVLISQDASHGIATVRIDDEHVQYVPDPGFTGVDLIGYQLVDPATGLTDTAVLTVDVEPNAVDDVAYTGVDDPLTIDVQTNDVCFDCVLTVTVSPAQGSAMVDGASILYTPPPGYAGSDAFEYRLTDPATGLTTDATVAVSVNDARPDSVVTDFETPVDVSIALNDECVGCAYGTTDPPAHGTVTVDPSGVATYTPDAGFSGLDEFGYDATGGPLVVYTTVTVLVAPPLQTHTLSNGQTAVGTVPLTPGACSSCTIEFIAGAVDGDLSFLDDGSYTYTPSQETATDSFTYLVTDPVTGLAVTGTIEITVSPNPAMSVSKSAGVATVGAVGDEVVFTVTVDNEGNAPLTSVVVDDPLCSLARIGGDTNGNDALDPSETWIYSCTYVVTQDDVDAGSVDNTVTVDATGPGGPLAAESSSTSVSVEQAPGLSVDKAADVSSVDDAGDEIVFTVTVDNTGDVTLDNIVVDDPLCPLVRDAGDGDGDDRLDVDETWIYSCTYVVSQDDVDAGSIDNTVTVDATGPGGPLAAESSSTSVSVEQAPGVSVDKAADVTSVDAPGDQIVFTVTVDNTGDVTLRNIVVDDPLCPLTLDAGDGDGDDRLDVDETWIYSCTYVVSQDDVDAGSIDNTVSVDARGPGGPLATESASESVTTAQTPGLSVAKSADVTSVDAAGDEVVFTVEVDNTGNVGLDGIVVDDPLCPLSLDAGDADADDRLDVGETWTYSCTYVVSQDDVDAGSVQNVVTVDATGPAGPLTQVPSAAVVPVVQGPGMAVAKSADVGSVDGAGDPVVFTVTVDNTGNVTLDDLAVDDPMCALALEAGDDGDGRLDVDESWTYSCTYVVTQADVDAGSIDNTVTVDATGPGGPLSTESASESVTADQAAGMSVVKSADVTSVDEPSDEIMFSVDVDNTGNVTLDGVAVDDPLCPLSLGAGDDDADDRLDPDETWTYTCAYVVSQHDADAGSVQNAVAVDATGPSGPLTQATAVAVVPVIQGPGMAVTKSADVASVDAAGDRVVFTVDVDNTGNVTLDDVVVDDPMCALARVGGDPDGDDALDSDEVWHYSCTYVATQADIDAGSIENEVTVDATGPGGPLPSGTASESVPADQTTELAVRRWADVDSLIAPGDEVVFTVTVENVGNTTIDQLAVDDPLCTLTLDSGDVDEDDRLDVDETWTYSCTYVATQDDIDAGSVGGTATVTGVDPSGSPLEPAAASSLVPAAQVAELTVRKTADAQVIDREGDEIVYQVDVTNTGNTTLVDVVADDPLCTLKLVDGDENVDSELDVDERWTYTCTYAVTAADVAAGYVENTVQVRAGGVDEAVAGRSSVSIPFRHAARLTVSKTADVETVDAEGDVIVFEIDVTNEGKAPLDQLQVDDPMCDLEHTATSDRTELRIGETWEYRCEYTVTARDLARTELVNTVIVDAMAPTGPVTRQRASATVDVVPAPEAPAPDVPAPDVPAPDAPVPGISKAATLPRTGAETWRLVQVALGMVLAGAGVVLLAASRRPIFD